MRFMRSQTSFGILISELISVEKLTYKKKMILFRCFHQIFRKHEPLSFFEDEESEWIGNGEKIGSHDPPSWRYDLVTRHPRPLTSPQRVYQRSLCRPFLYRVWKHTVVPKYGGFSSMHVNQHVAKADPIICFSKACRSKLTRFREEFSSFS